jgi:NAD(P)-dependent dehydrogenase (short-subunit alcohol dehydrogenase family)
VTGAAGDIGRAASLCLGARGWALALTDHPAAGDGLRATAAACEATGAAVWTRTFDVTDAGEVREAFHACVSELGAPTGVFNNAGVQGDFAPIDRYAVEDLRRVLDVNVVGAFVVLREAGIVMGAAGRGGAIVNSASMAGVSGAPNMPAYSASKAAIIGLTKSAAKDLAPAGIRVNAVSPAFIGPGRMWDTQVARQAAVGSQYFPADPDEVARQMIGMVPLRRYGSTDEVARVVAFLLSDDASYVNGVNVEISGGSV